MGEFPQDTWTDPHDYIFDVKKGVGEVNYDVYKRLKSSNPNLHFSLDAVMYPADPVFPDIPFGVSAYLASVKSGVTEELSDIAATVKFCGPGVKFILLGYSSGAWVTHRVLHHHPLPSSTLSRVVGVGLAGDPLFQPGSKIVRDFKLRDLSNGAAVEADPLNAAVPKTVTSVTGSYCFPNDVVCQSNAANLTTLLACGNGDQSCAHLRYVKDGETTKEADFLGRNLPAQTVWPSLSLGKPPVGTVGKSNSWKVTAKPTGRTYKWSTVGTVPPGLAFVGGVLSGTPAKAGVYSFAATATDPQLRSATKVVSVTVNSGGALAITTASLPDGTAGTAYSATVDVTGGYLPYAWNVSGTALSAGLNFDQKTGTLQGTPDQAGQFSLVVKVTDSKGASVSRTFSLTVASAPVTAGAGSDWTQLG